MIFLTLLIKMFACSGILFGYYLLFLRNKRFHHYNRFYLLAATALSVVVPFIKIPVFFESNSSAAQIANNSIEIISVNRWEEDFAGTTPTSFIQLLSLQGAMMIVYGAVVFVLAILLCRSLFYILRLSKKYPHQYINTIKFYDTVEPGTPFSFLRSIFWNRNLKFNSKEGQQIFQHELFHVKERHSVDTLFMEVITIVFWINPLFHLIKKEIKAIHEFLADQHAVSDNNGQEYAELLIVQSINIKKTSVSNYFFQNHIKRRIAMITQMKSKKYGYFSRLLVLPLSALVFCAITVYAKAPTKPSKEKMNEFRARPSDKSLTVLIDAGHGGEDAGARSKQGLQEKDLALAIARKVEQHSSAFNVNVIMTRTDDAYPSLRQRTEQAKMVKADLVVSIHIGASPDAEQNNGFDIYVTNKNQETVLQSKVLAQSIADRMKSLYTTQPIKQRKEHGIWILDAAPCPAVLIECGYISNEKDVAFISEIQNQEQIAKKILEGIANYQLSAPTQPVTDTVPSAKRKKDSANAIQDKRRAQLQEQKMEDRQRETELEELKLEEQRREIEIKNEALSRRQKEISMKERALQEKIERAAAQQERELAEMQKKMQSKQQLQQQLQERDELLQKQHQQRLSKQAKIQEARNQQIHREQEALEQRQLQIQNKQKALLELQEELQAEQLQNIEEEPGKAKPSSPKKPQPHSSDFKKKPRTSKPGLEKQAD